MTNVRKIALLAVLLFTGYFAVKQVAQQAPACTNQTLQESGWNTNGEITYNVECLPTLTTNLNAPTDAFWRIFFSAGNGQFWMGTLDDFKRMRFKFDTIGKFATWHSSFVEYTAAYDDTKDPRHTPRPKTQGLCREITPTDPFFSNNLNGSNHLVNLQSTTEPSPGDSIWYIITYQGTNAYSNYNNNGSTVSLKFTYDHTKLHFAYSEVFGQEVVTDNPLNDQVVIQVPNKVSAGNQRNIFLYFVTDAAAGNVNQQMNPKPKVQYFLSENGNSTEMDIKELTTQAIVSSHDPSFKDLTDSTWHQDQGVTYADFEITIQNDGAKMVDNITIEDMLDPLLLDSISLPVLQLGSQDQLNQSIAAFTSPPILSTLPVVNRNHIINWNNLRLRGMREPGLGNQFMENDTKAKLKIRCYLGPKAGEYDCSAVCNQARVKFGCHPFYHTNITMLQLPCDNPSSTCTELKDTTITLSTVPGNGQPLAPANLATALTQAGFKKFKWYPTKGLNDPFSLNTTYTPTDQQTYTLVASDPTNCKRRVYYLNLPVCHLGITVSDSCSNGKSYLVATATGYQGSSTQLIWHDCKFGSRRAFQVYPDRDKIYYFGVTDQSTGCTSEVTFQVADLQPCNAGDNWVRILLVIVGVILGVIVITSILANNKNPD